MIQYCRIPSPVGLLTLTARADGLTGIWFDRHEPALPVNLPPCRPKDHPVLKEAAAWLEDYFSGKRPDPARVPLAPEGTLFQRTVWQLLSAIPYGKTTTYGQLAAQTAALLGRSVMSARAVGSAVGRNPISILIPCHRVMGTEGRLTGFGGGLDRKVWLLTHEGLDAAGFRWPKEKQPR